MVRVHAAIVPGLFTMANMFCGYYAVLLASEGKFVPAAWFIIAAGVLDVLDGKLARMTDTSSEFGVQYDSLADVVSFGFAPSALGYFLYFHQWGTIGLFISFLPLTFGAIRLARFNVRTTDENKHFFEGLPSPAAAVLLATFVIFNFHFWGFLRWSKLFLTLTLLGSFLMVTLIRYEKMPNFSLNSTREMRVKILLVLLSIILLIFFPQELFFPLTALYVLSGPTRLTWLIMNPERAKKVAPYEVDDE